MWIKIIEVTAILTMKEGPILFDHASVVIVVFGSIPWDDSQDQAHCSYYTINYSAAAMAQSSH